MSTKPVTLPRWSDVSGSVVTPSSAKQDVGWVTAEKPPAQYLNWLALWNYKWAQYLSDGAFQGASTFDSTLGVTGLITATGGVTAAALITANAGVTAGANTDVTVSGTGKFKHGTRTKNVPLMYPTQAVNPAFQINLTSANHVAFPIDLPVGARILQVRASVIDSATGPTKLVCGLRTINNSGSTVSGTGTASTGAGGGAQTINSAAALNVTLAALTMYCVDIGYNTGTAGCTVNFAEIDYDQL